MQKYYATTKIPTSLLKNEIEFYSTIGAILYIFSNNTFPVLSNDANPSILFYSEEIIYRCINIENTEYTMILGPVFECPISDSVVNIFMHESIIPIVYREQVSELLYTIPKTSRLNLAQYLSFLHLVINHKNVNIQRIVTIQNQCHLVKRITN